MGVLLRRRRSRKAIKKATIQPPRKEPTIAPASVPVLNLLPDCEAFLFVGRKVPEVLLNVEERDSEESSIDEVLGFVGVDVEGVVAAPVSEVTM